MPGSQDGRELHKGQRKMTRFMPVKTYYMARKLCPNAVTIAKVEGGYMCFASHSAYKTWRAQK